MTSAFNSELTQSQQKKLSNAQENVESSVAFFQKVLKIIILVGTARNVLYT